MSRTCIAVDFGTSQTLVAVFNGKTQLEPEIHTIIGGRKNTPTAVELDKNGNVVTFGRDAIKKKNDKNSNNVFYNFKPWIGMRQSYRCGEREYTPEQLSSIFLECLREKIEEKIFNGKKLKEQPDIYCVIGHPAEWVERQKDKLKEIAEAAGFPRVELCEEPWGVICYYHRIGTLQCDRAKNILVYDFGGGTTDVAIEQMQAGDKNGRMQKPERLGTGGNQSLGGMDFDKVLFKHFIKELKLDEDPDDFTKKYPMDSKNIELVVKTLKEELSESDDAEEETPILRSAGEAKTLKITKDQFKSLCARLIECFEEPINYALKQAKLGRNEIDHVILAGGSSQMPYVKERIYKLFPKDKVIQSADPVEVVVKGLAIYGEMRSYGTEQPINKTEPGALQTDTTINLEQDISNSTEPEPVQKGTTINLGQDLSGNSDVPDKFPPFPVYIKQKPKPTSIEGPNEQTAGTVTIEQKSASDSGEATQISPGQDKKGKKNDKTAIVVILGMFLGCFIGGMIGGIGGAIICALGGAIICLMLCGRGTEETENEGKFLDFRKNGKVIVIIAILLFLLFLLSIMTVSTTTTATWN